MIFLYWPESVKGLSEQTMMGNNVTITPDASDLAFQIPSRQFRYPLFRPSLLVGLVYVLLLCFFVVGRH